VYRSARMTVWLCKNNDFTLPRSARRAWRTKLLIDQVTDWPSDRYEILYYVVLSF